MRARAPIVQYWDTGEPPVYVLERQATFREFNPGNPHMVFSEETACEFIAEHFDRREVDAFRACAVPTMQSDYFRYCAVYVLGGLYADVGFRCVGALGSLFEGSADAWLVRRDPMGYLLSGLFFFEAPGHPLPRLVLDIASTNIERRVAERVQMVTGPWILSGLSLLHRLGLQDAFCDEVDEQGLPLLFEPFCREAATLVPTAGARKWIRRVAEPFFDAVGSYSRVKEAFDGVTVTPLEEVTKLIAEPDDLLPYKQGDRYWLNWQRGRSIFR